MTYDVVIVGLGPVGATAAALLAHNGVQVAVIEQAAAIYDKPRAITFDHEIARVFQNCGIGGELPGFSAPHLGTHFLWRAKSSRFPIRCRRRTRLDGRRPAHSCSRALKRRSGPA